MINTLLLKEIARKRQGNIDFVLDVLVMTLGISHVKFTVGEKAKYDGIEHFFFSAIQSKHSCFSGFSGKIWPNLIDLGTWADGVTTMPIEQVELSDFIDQAIKECNEVGRDDHPEQPLDKLLIDLPRNFDHCWMLIETVDERLSDGASAMYLAESGNCYYYFEAYYSS